MVISQHQVVRAVVRGDRPIEALSGAGIQLESTKGGLRVDIPAGFKVELPLVDLAFGLLASWARGTELREWASTILAVSEIEFTEIDSRDGEALLDALWTAAAGEGVSDVSLEAARQLAE